MQVKLRRIVRTDTHTYIQKMSLFYPRDYKDDMIIFKISWVYSHVSPHIQIAP
jgi:hypothetical protein